MFGKLSLGVCILSALVVAAGCASTTEEAEAEVTEGAQSSVLRVDQRTQSFSGTFSVRLMSRTVPMSFEITNIDWTALTARFSAKPLTSVGAAGMVFTKVRPSRCAGCYTFDVIEGAGSMSDNTHPLAHITFSDSLLSSISYVDIEATDAKLTSINAASAATGLQPARRAR